MTRPGRGGLAKRISLFCLGALLLTLFVWVLSSRQQGAADRWMTQMRATGERLSFIKEGEQSLRAERVTWAVWRSLWAEGDTLVYLQHCQTQIDSLRTFANDRALARVAPALASAQSKLDAKFGPLSKYRYP